MHQQKEVSQTAIRQSLVNGDFSFPLAERVSLDVWVMHIVVSGLCQGNNSIGLGITEFTPSKANFKLSQVDFFQNHCGSTDDDFLFGPVDTRFVEFVGQRTEFCIDFLQGWNRRMMVDSRQFTLVGGQLTRHCRYNLLVLQQAATESGRILMLLCFRQ